MTPHNPDELNDEQIGVKKGWRLIDRDEIISEGKQAPAIDGLEMWLITRWSGMARANSEGSSYRTKLSREQLATRRMEL